MCVYLERVQDDKCENQTERSQYPLTRTSEYPVSWCSDKYPVYFQP